MTRHGYNRHIFYPSPLEGRRDPFKGLATEKLATEWTSYPVLHFGLSRGKHEDKDTLNHFLISQMRDNEENPGFDGMGDDTDGRLSRLIKQLYKRTGKQTVVLIDEYAAPLLDVVHEETNLSRMLSVL